MRFMLLETGNLPRDLVYKLKHRETKHKNGYFSYFMSASKSRVSSSSDSDCSSSTSKPPFKSGSGIRRYNKKWEETFPWLKFDENLQGAF